MVAGTPSQSSPAPTITFHPYARVDWGAEVAIPCHCGTSKKPPSMVLNTTATDPGFNIECTQPPPGATVQVEVPSGSPNAFICTQAPWPTDFNLRLNAANVSPKPNMQLPLGSYVNGMSSEDVTTGAIGSLGVVALLAIGSTIWYRRKYLSVLSTNRQNSTASKSKRQ